MANSYKPTQAEFDKDVAGHRMTVRLDQGIHRHLHFKLPGRSVFWFDIITAPGILIFTGDMGGYTFRRLDDMFAFFRADDGRINPRYWAEKVEAECRTDGIAKFSPEKFRRFVFEYVRDWVRDNRDRCTREERRALWDEIDADVLNADPNGVRMFDAANDFQHTLNAGCKFHFRDVWDHNFDEYTYRFIWCCRALVWAIKQYDAAKAPTAEAVEVAHG